MSSGPGNDPERVEGYMSYQSEAHTLDTEILSCIEQRRVPDFNDLALRIFAHQIRYNEPYARYCASLGVTLQTLPSTWEAIPPIPAAAFKEASLTTFDPSRAELTFQTSGTTLGLGGKHYMENATVYDAALLAGFRDAMLREVPQRLRYLLFVPNPAERPRSSLGYMMRRVADSLGDGNDRWYLQGDALDVNQFVRDAHAAATDEIPVCIAATAFALVQLLDALNDTGIRSLPLPPLSRIMETGGFKGRSRVVERGELYKRIADLFQISANRLVAEYGMTELTSQYYDATFDDVRIKRAGPWLRSRVVGPDGTMLPMGIVGALAHIDLGNRSSCVAVQTEDLGVAVEGYGVILIGREHGAELRGCSLDAEQLRALSHS